MIKENLKLVKQLRYQLHQYPEPSYEENITKETLMKFLKDNTSLEIIDEGKWFYAIHHGRENARNIAFRADFDAIKMDEYIDIPHGSKNKGVAHKCGHDGHAATLCGLALEIDQSGSNNNVFFLFQHAEETAQGAIECKKIINDRKIDEIFAYHNTSGVKKGSVLVIDGTNNFASKGMIIEMVGVPSHASLPEHGRNPAYAIAEVISELPKIENKPKYKGIVLSTVIQVDVGEEAFGIAAHKGKLLITFRAELEEDFISFEDSIISVIRRVANENGLELNISYKDEFPVTTNHKKSVDKIRTAAKNLGYDIVELDKGFRGSEDFGYYTKETEGAICYIGNGIDYPPVHTKEYDFNDEIIEHVVELFKELLLL
jgi:amidohydrolase